MALRSFRERLCQTLAYETGGLVVATPLYGIAFGAAATESVLVVGALALVALVWSPLHNAVFDLAEWRLARRRASDRPHRLRLLHALTHEASSIVVTLPMLMALGDLGFLAALAADAGLTLVYAIYGYGFHLLYDRLRPVCDRPRPRPITAARYRLQPATHETRPRTLPAAPPRWHGADPPSIPDSNADCARSAASRR